MDEETLDPRWVLVVLALAVVSWRLWRLQQEVLFLSLLLAGQRPAPRPVTPRAPRARSSRP